MADSIVLPDPGLWLATHHLQQSQGLSFWDALIVAACIKAGVRTLYSEDFSDHRNVDGLTIINPFVQ